MPVVLACVAAVAIGLFIFSQVVSQRLDRRFPARGEFVRVGAASGSLHYTQRLPAKDVRAVVVLLHGASGSEADMLEALGDALAARGFRVLAFDRPGHGWSDRLGAETVALQANAIVEALSKLHIDSAICVGHSLSGVLATNLAIAHKSLVSGLVLVAPVTHPWPGGGLDLYYRIASHPVWGTIFNNLIATPAGLAMLRRSLASVFAPQPTPDDYGHRTGVARVLRPRNFGTNARDVAGTYEFVLKQAPRLGEILAPTVIVTGDADNIVLTKIHSYGSARDIPGAELVILPGVGHSPHWADPQAIVDAIENVAARAGVRPLVAAST